MKVSALGSRGFFGGYDLSGDLSSLGGIEQSVNQLDTSSIVVSSTERLNLRGDGKFSFNAILNPTAGQSHPVLKAMPSTELDVMWTQADAIGAISAMLAAKQATYNMALGTDGSGMLSADALAAMGFGVEWGFLVTAGKRQDTSASATGLGADMAATLPAAITVTSASAVNPTSVLTATAHGLVTGDSVVIAGTNKAALNDEWTVTFVDATHFTVPLDLTSGAASGGTVIKTSTNTGWAAHRQSFSFTGTSSTITVQHAARNLAGSFVDLANGAFTPASGANTPGAERITGTSTAILQRYVRVKTTGTFSEHTFAVGVARL